MHLRLRRRRKGKLGQPRSFKRLAHVSLAEALPVGNNVPEPLWRDILALRLVLKDVGDEQGPARLQEGRE